MEETNSKAAARTHNLGVQPPRPLYAGRMGRPSRPIPASTTPEWPNRPSPDPVAETARLLALNLSAALTARGLSLRQARDATGVDHTAIADIINGHTWPDLHTIARLEHGLETDLWPGRPPSTGP